MTKVAWVTGAGKGLGQQVSLQLAAGGWCVVVTSRTADDLQALAADAQHLAGSIHPFPADIIDRDGIDCLVATIEDQIGPLDLAILNAGTYLRFGLEDFSAERFAHQMAINVNGTVNCLSPVLKRMKNRRQGQIAVVSSLSAHRGLPMASAYGASKAALTNMCEALKPECDVHGVGLSVVHPGFVRTPLTDQNEFPMPFLMSADDAARRLINGLNERKFDISFPTRFALLMRGLRCLPDAVYFWLTRRMVQK
ncbi:MAG: oxidoreductase [Rhodospirillaceae bacterium]|nr:oxidoreductase [Rhodospirillaceae bacterium]